MINEGTLLKQLSIKAYTLNKSVLILTRNYGLIHAHLNFPYLIFRILNGRLKKLFSRTLSGKFPPFSNCKNSSDLKIVFSYTIHLSSFDNIPLPISYVKLEGQTKCLLRSI